LASDSFARSILAKVEPPEFIHVYIRAKEGGLNGKAPQSTSVASALQAAQGVLSELPRLGLEFLLQGQKRGGNKWSG